MGNGVTWRAEGWPELEGELAGALTEPEARVRRIESRGAVFWLKRCERPSLRFRIQKGNPARNFAHEVAALKRLGAAGLPVPAIMAEGPGFVLLADAGTPLRDVLAQRRGDGAAQAAAMAAAGQALAALHAAGVAHGRPALRDMCLGRDGRVSFIDLENTRLGAEGETAPMARMRRDLIAFAHDTLKLLSEDGPAAEAGFAAYRGADGRGIWDDTARWLARHRWPLILTRPLQDRRNGRGKDFRAIPLVYRVFTGRG